MQGSTGILAKGAGKADVINASPNKMLRVLSGPINVSGSSTGVHRHQSLNKSYIALEELGKASYFTDRSYDDVS